MAGGPTRSKWGVYAASWIHMEEKLWEKTAAAKATYYLLAAEGMSTINRRHHVRVDMEMW